MEPVLEDAVETVWGAGMMDGRGWDHWTWKHVALMTLTYVMLWVASMILFGVRA